MVLTAAPATSATASAFSVTRPSRSPNSSMRSAMPLTESRTRSVALDSASAAAIASCFTASVSSRTFSAAAVALAIIGSTLEASRPSCSCMACCAFHMRKKMNASITTTTSVTIWAIPAVTKTTWSSPARSGVTCRTISVSVAIWSRGVMIVASAVGSSNARAELMAD